MTLKGWPLIFLALLSGSNAAPLLAAATEHALSLRDPEIFQGPVLADLLDELSFDPDVRIAVDSADLRGLAETQTLNDFRRPRLKAVSDAGYEPNSLVSLVAREGLSAGMDPGYMVRLANRESHFDRFAELPTSTAAGLFQFTDNTWLCSLRDFGSGLGVAGSDQIRRTRRGVCETSDPAERSRLLALRADATLSTKVAAAFSLRNYRTLASQLGRSPSATELYVLHFFGENVGLRFLDAYASRPTLSGAYLAPGAAASNERIFFTGAGRPRSVAEVFDQLRLRRVG